MSKQLAQYGPYERYMALASPPLGVEAFKDGDSPHLGEVFCRIDVHGEVCGKKVKSTGALSTHAKRHGTTALGKAEGTGNPSLEKISAAKGFYSQIMRKHDEIALQTAPEQVQPPGTPSRPRAKRNIPLPTESQPVQPPDKEDRHDIPTYKKANKKARISKGDINYKVMRKLLKDYNVIMPCKHCIDENKNRCEFTEGCAGVAWFKGWEDSDDDEEV
ncbi:hypothetical protein HBI81_247510 [Parastagonospora nodorum]|nr:hypothetical protein HBI81_247510 [Parastagonospora nodorum]